MPARRVQIWLDEDLLRGIDRDPEAREKGRSAFIRAATELYLRAKEHRSVDDAIRAAYQRRAEELLAEVENMLAVQAWPHE